MTTLPPEMSASYASIGRKSPRYPREISAATLNTTGKSKYAKKSSPPVCASSVGLAVDKNPAVLSNAGFAKLYTVLAPDETTCTAGATSTPCAFNAPPADDTACAPALDAALSASPATGANSRWAYDPTASPIGCTAFTARSAAGNTTGATSFASSTPRSTTTATLSNAACAASAAASTAFNALESLSDTEPACAAGDAPTVVAIVVNPISVRAEAGLGASDARAATLERRECVILAF
mmetsp:Transcript_8689/g.32359  ORF Transcript_8689/g.32359 Transcript_8689/m.32359 type:complete len:238 (+) Transcript_8689:466-1179(+)